MSATTPFGGPFVTDAGMETDLVFNRGVDLPEFAAFPLIQDEAGAALLESYYTAFVGIAQRAEAGLLLESPTWRANPDWADKLGYDAAALDRANREAVAMMRRVQEKAELERSLVVGIVGPRGDGYIAGERPDPDEAADYHSAQIGSFAAAGVDLVHAMTMTTPQEAIGVTRAARDAGLPVMISFTVETDGLVPDGSTLAASIALVDAEAAPDCYGVNCAHPTHVAPAFDGGAWQDRIVGLRPNASTLSHEELDASEVLDPGDLGVLQSSLDRLRPQLKNLKVVGGCCGTDAKHVAALWGV